MKLNLKEAWKSVRVIAGGYTSHHASPTIVRVRLPNGELAMTDAENTSVFGPHFHRLFENHKPIDWTMLCNIKQRYMMENLDHPISWDDIKKPPQM